MFDFSPTDDQKQLQSEIVAFAREHLNQGVEEREKEQRFDRSLWEKCGEIGLPGLTIPKEYGGRGLNALSTVLAFEALGYGCEDGGLNFALGAHLLACTIPIWKHGSDHQKKTYLPLLCNGKMIAANAMTEQSAGSDVYSMVSVAVAKENAFLLTGLKSYVSNGPVADLALTYVQTDPEKGFFGGISAFILDKSIHDYSCSDRIEKLGIRTCMLGEISFDNLSVEDGYLLGQLGGGGMIFNQSMDWERTCLGAIHLGTMDRLLEKAVKFAKKRKSAGKSLSNYQAVTHPLADLKVRLESARLLNYKAAWKLDQNKNVGLEASMAKLAVSETYKSLAIQLNQLYAGQAFRDNHEAQRALKDAIAGTVYSGTSEVQRNIIARRIGLT